MQRVITGRTNDQTTRPAQAVRPVNFYLVVFRFKVCHDYTESYARVLFCRALDRVNAATGGRLAANVANIKWTGEQLLVEACDCISMTHFSKEEPDFLDSQFERMQLYFKVYLPETCKAKRRKKAAQLAVRQFQVRASCTGASAVLSLSGPKCLDNLTCTLTFPARESGSWTEYAQRRQDIYDSAQPLSLFHKLIPKTREQPAEIGQS